MNLSAPLYMILWKCHGGAHFCFRPVDLFLDVTVHCVFGCGRLGSAGGIPCGATCPLFQNVCTEISFAFCCMEVLHGLFYWVAIRTCQTRRITPDRARELHWSGAYFCLWSQSSITEQLLMRLSNVVRLAWSTSMSHHVNGWNPRSKESGLPGALDLRRHNSRPLLGTVSASAVPLQHIVFVVKQ